MSAFNGSGTFVISGTGLPFVTGTTISSTVANQLNTDLATGLSTCVTKDGQTTPTANLPMGGFKHTTVADGTAANQYASVGQLQNRTAAYAAAGGTADALTATFSPAYTALTDGMQIVVKAASANATATPTLAVNALTATTITKLGGKSLAIGDIYGAGHELSLVYSSTGTRWELLNPAVLPTQQRLTSGTAATYTTPPGCLQIRVRMMGAGGGGAGATAGGGVVGASNGGTTTFKDVTAIGGSGGAFVGGAGGTGGSNGTGTTSVWRQAGNSGGGGIQIAATATGVNPPSGVGGAGPWGGAGAPVTSGTGTAGTANSGAGGSGAVSGAGPTYYQSGGGGGSGEYVEFIINSPAATYTYTITSGGAGGVSTQTGGAGGSGVIIVDEYY